YEPLNRDKTVRFPQLQKAWLELGQVLLARYKFRDFNTALRAVLRSNPRSTRAIFQAALAHYQQGHFEQCQCVVARGLAYDPDDLNLVYLDSLLKYREKYFRAALEGFARILKRNPAHYPSYMLAAACHLGLEELDAAAARATQAQTMSPELEEPYL